MHLRLVCYASTPNSTVQSREQTQSVQFPCQLAPSHPHPQNRLALGGLYVSAQ